MVREALYTVPDAPRKLRPEIPEKLSSVLLKMLEPDPAKRAGSLDKLIQTIGELGDEIPFPTENTVEERAIERPSPRPKPHAVTEIDEQSAPTGFFASQIFPKSKFFEDDTDRYRKIQETLRFYREGWTSQDWIRFKQDRLRLKAEPVK